MDKVTRNIGSGLFALIGDHIKDCEVLLCKYIGKSMFLLRIGLISKIVRSYLVSKSENRQISRSGWVSRLCFERFA